MRDTTRIRNESLLSTFLFVSLICFVNQCKSDVIHYNTNDPDCTGAFGLCTQEDKDRLGYAAIKKLHAKMDEDSDGEVEFHETKEFMKEELQYKNGVAYNERQQKFHGNDMLISVDEMWKSWKHSQVYNWTTDELVTWLTDHVKQPQYADYFRRNLIDGQFLPRLALNENNYYSNVMHIKDPRHRRLIMVKATDLVLFGQQHKPYNLIKDIFYTSFIKSEFMYKNLIGLRKIDPKLNLKKNKTSSEKDNTSMKSGSLNAFDLENETDTDLYEEDVTSYSCTRNSILEAANDSLNEEMDDEFDEEALNMNDLNKSTRSIRLDLMNEIKDEITDEQALSASKSKYNEQDEEDDEEDEIEGDESTVDNVNLANLRICIDEIEELTDKSNKTCYVFVIQVWNLQPAFDRLQRMNEAGGAQDTLGYDEVPTWSVKRKYDEFYVLDTRLKEFHGGLLNAESSGTNRQQISVSLPSKQRVVFLQSNAKHFEYLNSVKNDFSKYLQSLITNPILALSQLIRSFLDPHSIEFSSSIFNDITNLSKIVKGVPYKLRLERGQSLDSFLLILLQSVRNAKSKPAQTTTNCLEDIVEKKLNNRLYNRPSGTSPIKKCSRSQQMEQKLNTPFESLFLLINLIYKLPTSICLIIFSLRKLIQKLVDYGIYLLVRRKINEFSTPDSLEKLIRLFKDILFETEPQAQQTSQVLHQTAITSLNEYLRVELLSKIMKIPMFPNEKVKEKLDEGTILFIESLQYPILNKQLSYYLFDALLQEMFPELLANNNSKKSATC